jgi:mRNA-degrading endonuclease toxin of MazEF toxin-antitoxin module
LKKDINFLEIWEVDLGEENVIGHEQKGYRPFVVISRNDYHKTSKTPIGFVLTLSNHKLDTKYSFKIKNEDGIEVSALLTQLRTLSNDRFKRKWSVQLGINEFSKLMEQFLNVIVGTENVNIQLGNLTHLLSDKFGKGL